METVTIEANGHIGFTISSSGEEEFYTCVSFAARGGKFSPADRIEEEIAKISGDIA